ncbi:MAG TPA: mechanosensitive ion channel domain-containing protein [Geobacteraceae bacterium]|nr:mechanosensitive ion channel domain-containing protein [Geobacteraceae bacterium]
MEIVSSWLVAVKNLLDFELFKSGTTVFTLWTILYLLIFLFLLFYLSGKLKEWLVEKILTKMALGARQALASIIRYAVIVIGVLIILQTAGINLTTFQVLAGAVGIGVGFGLQNIVSNFVSGLIILFERPIQIGDRIEVGNVEGDVIAINARSTTVVTNDNIAIIIPNTKFITENVVNWSLTGKDVRFRIPVSIASDSDMKRVVELLEEVARNNPDVLDSPPPSVRFLQFGDSGLNLELRVWSTTLTHRKATLVSALNFAIHEKFRENGIEIPYPQREIRFRTGIPGEGRPEVARQAESDS